MANKIYRATETPIIFTDSSGNKAIALNNMSFGTGQVSEQYDRGAGSVAQYHEVIGVVQYKTNQTPGDAVELYIYQGDGTYTDGGFSSSGVMVSDKRKNGMLVGAVLADAASSGTINVGRFLNVPITSRYYSVGMWNAAAAGNLVASGNICRVIVTPMPDEIQ